MFNFCPANATSICSGSDAGTKLLASFLSTLLLTQISLKEQYEPDRSHNYLPSYDFIVVGSGSGGSPVSAALASNPKWNVLLVEAGDDPQLNSKIPFLFSTIQTTYQDWQYVTEPQENSCLIFENQQCPWPLGKLIGGTSAISYLVYCMGNPRDYDEWEMLGNKGWNWENVRKYFDNQMQNTLQPEFLNEQQFYTDDCPAFTFSSKIISQTRNAILKAGREMGYRNLVDIWEKLQGVSGFYDTPLTIRNGERNSAARVFVAPLLKQNNFHLIKNGHVTKVLIDPKTKTVKGVQVWLKNHLVEIKAEKEVILSAGAINTPQILMLSGIGPKQHLIDLNIEPIEDLPVGEHLQDHPGAIIPLAICQNIADKNSNIPTIDDIYEYFTKRQGILGTPSTTNMVAYFDPQNRDNNVGEISLHFIYVNKNNTQSLLPFNFWDYFRRTLEESLQKSSLILVFISLLRPKSEGSIKLKSANPFDAPAINPNTHSHPDDLKMLLGGYRQLQKFVRTEAMQAEGAEFVKLNFEKCKQYEYDSDEYCICLIKHLSSTIYHPVGTARMGISNDSVVDPRLRVRGIKGLRIADGSIMPKIIGGNTNGPIIMIGQKLGDLIKEDWSNLDYSQG